MTPPSDQCVGPGAVLVLYFQEEFRGLFGIGFVGCGEISPPRRRGTFPSMGKYPKDRRGTAPDEHFVLIVAFPPDPHYGGRVPAGFCSTPGAQNLSGWCLSLPGHWALGLHKFPLVRFHNCAWIYRANAPGVEYAVGAAPCGLPRAGLEPAPTQKTHQPLYLP